MHGGDGGDCDISRGGGGRGKRGGLLFAGRVKDPRKIPGVVSVRREMNKREAVPDPGGGSKGDSGGSIGLVVSRGDLMRRNGATVSPFIVLVAKLVDDDDEFEVEAEVKEPYVELGLRKGPAIDSEADVEMEPDED